MEKAGAFLVSGGLMEYFCGVWGKGEADSTKGNDRKKGKGKSKGQRPAGCGGYPRSQKRDPSASSGQARGHPTLWWGQQIPFGNNKKKSKGKGSCTAGRVLRKSFEERVIRPSVSTRSGWKSGKGKGNRGWRGFARGVSFRKLCCGIEGKWKAGS